MILRLAFRNVLRNLPRLRPLLIIFAATFALLTTVNALLEYTQQSFSASYVDYVSGDLSITELTETRFTLFGTDTVLIGEYLTPPVLVDPDVLEERIRGLQTVGSLAFLVTTPARLEVGDRRIRSVAFGVQFSRYRELFPELLFVSGSWPPDGDAAALVQDHTYRRLFGTDDYTAHLGEPLLLAGATQDTFSLREVTLAGVYRYPGTDEALRSVVLVDAPTARALAGYLYSNTSSSVPQEQEPLLSGSVDDLFGQSDSGVRENDADDSALSVFDELDALLSAPTEAPVSTVDDGSAGAWNFALVRAADNASARQLTSSVEDRLRGGRQYAVLDWRRTVGGNVLIVYYVRLLANIGVLCVALAAVIITTNSLVLSILERTTEIGTMRALGARRGTITSLLVLETLYVVLGSSAVGIIVGIVLSQLLNTLDLTADNQYLRILFGGGQIRTVLTPALIFSQLAVGLGLSVAALLYPLSRALRLQPIEAVNS